MKKILLVADQKGWVFDAHCQEIKKRIAEYHIDIAYHRQNIVNLSQNYDLIYVLDPMPMRYPSPSKTIIGLRCEFLFREHPDGAEGLYKNGFPGRCVSIKDKCCIFHVVNRNQMRIFRNIVKDKPLLLAQHGVNEEIFDDGKIYEVKKYHDPLIVSTSGRGSSNKGFEIVKNACLEAGVQYKTAQYGKRKILKEEMPLFYYDMDVHVCMSKNEGLNNPLMEAAAMGVPIISTRCGASEEIIKDGENGFLIDRNRDALVNALKKMRDPMSRLEMGKKAREEVIKNWTWKVRIEDFRKMFALYFEKG